MEAVIDKKKVINFAIPGSPFSSDPMEYDSYVHHYAFTSVFGKLISEGSAGSITPIIAEKWNNADDFKTWHFTIRKGLNYSNGDLITISDIEKNFKRISFLKHQNNSESGVLEFLKGYESIKNLQDPIEGIVVDDTGITFKFVKPMPDLLEKLSFGFYAIAHPSLYDEHSGMWKDNKNVIASGPYQVTQWDENHFRLSLRKNVLYIDYSKSIKEFNLSLINKIKDSNDLEKIDLIVADQKSLLVNDDFVFNGSTNGLKIGYVQCYSWNNPKSPFSDIKVRRWFRQKFYQGLKNSNFKTTTSFFPLALNGVKEVGSVEEYEKPSFEKFIISTSTLPNSAKLNENKNKKSLSEVFQSAMNNLGNDSGAEVQFEEFNEGNANNFDLLINGSGIEASDYWETVKFMFNSKQGIQLPDSDGSIKKELKLDNPNIQKINEALWDQAIIWPIRHYSSGFWFNKNSNLDYSSLNFDSPAIDFQFLKWN